MSRSDNGMVRGILFIHPNILFEHLNIGKDTGKTPNEGGLNPVARLP